MVNWIFKIFRFIWYVSLFIFAWILIPILSSINFLLVFDFGYFLDSAASLDRWGNREYRRLFNKLLIKNNGYNFGNINETISSVLGKNQRDNTLSKCGVILVKILDFLDKDHCYKSINDLV